MPRPSPRFHDFIGHKQHVDGLRRQLAGALARNEPFPHSLFFGPSGAGKTRLASALAAEYGTNLIEAMGHEDLPALSRKLSALNQGDFLLIDECHRLRPLVQETLCEAIDWNSIPNLDFKKPDKGDPVEVRTALKPWTLVLASDQPGLLLDALHKRIVIEVHLNHYPAKEMKEITEVMASELNVLISPQAARMIAEVAGGLPRRAKQLLKKLRNHHPNAEAEQLGVSHIRDFLDASGIDQNGLTESERFYLKVVKELGGASLESIALSLGTDSEYVRRQIEPGLVRRRFIRIGPGGRQTTPLGESILQGQAEAVGSSHVPNGDPT